MKIHLIYFLSAVMMAGMLAGCGSEKKVHAETAELPQWEWQSDVTFPDWKSSRSSNTAANNRLGFIMYSGQGSIYITPEEGCTQFTLYINDRKVDIDIPEAGKTVRADISAYTRNGINSLQVSDIKTGKVRVCIPYPSVISGKPEDVGISKDSLDLISRIISADIANGFSSAQLAVIKDGRLVYENAWGKVKTYDEAGSPAESGTVNRDTLYDLASNTKMYSVNYAVQHLLDQGKISLDAKITEILGERYAEDTIRIDYEGYEPVTLEEHKARKAKQTVRDLLMHQGGFPPGPHYYNDRYDHATQYYDSDSGNVIYTGAGADEKTRNETLEAIFKTPLMYEPGTDDIYSDMDYMVLCYCVEKITGMRLDQYLKETFFDPMGLARICYNPLQNGFTKEDCAATELMGNSRAGRLHFTGIREYTLQGEVHDPNAYYCMNGISGHAGLFASASDLAKLASVMLTGGYEGHRFFSRDTIDLFVTPKNASAPYYGLGWWREADRRRDTYFGSVSGSAVYGHQGFTGTLTMIDPSQNLVVVFLTNKIHSTMRLDDDTLSQYDGGFYTTASLGFVPQILEIGMNGNTDREVYRSLVFDMAADKERILTDYGIIDPEHPHSKALKALREVLEQTK